MRRTACWLCVIGALGVTPVWGESNLEDGVYPAPDCGAKPQAPVRPEAFETEDQVRAYNDQVNAYNNQVEAYFECIQGYVNRAAADIKLIKQQVKAVVDAAND